MRGNAWSIGGRPSPAKEVEKELFKIFFCICYDKKMAKKKKNSFINKQFFMVLVPAVTMFFLGLIVGAKSLGSKQAYCNTIEKNSAQNLRVNSTSFSYDQNFECPSNYKEERFERVQFCVPSDLQQQETEDRLIFTAADSSNDYLFTVGKKRYGLYDSGAYCAAKNEIYAADKDYFSYAVYKASGDYFNTSCDGLASRIVLVESEDNYFIEYATKGLNENQQEMRSNQFKALINSIEVN
jgi:hypothetical protein